MRVLFDGYWLPNGVISGRRVVEEIIRAWSVGFPEDELLVASPARGTALDLPENVRQIRSRLGLHPLINALELPVLAKHHDVDWIFAQNFCPLFGRRSVFLHDVLFQSNPEWFSVVERIYFRAMILMMPRAHRIFTSSNSEARRIAKFNRQSRKPTAVGLGVSTELTRALPERPQMEIDTRCYLLAVGRLNVRKNLARLINGALLSGCISSDFPLVIAGERAGVSEGLSDEARSAVEEGSIRFTGHVTDHELRWLYEHCSLMCYLTLDEGFGLPPVEAMHFGAPVLASDIPVMHENLGSYAEYVNPYSIDAIAGALQRFLIDSREVTSQVRPIYDWAVVVKSIRDELIDASAR